MRIKRGDLVIYRARNKFECDFVLVVKPLGPMKENPTSQWICLGKEEGQYLLWLTPATVVTSAFADYRGPNSIYVRPYDNAKNTVAADIVEIKRA